MQATLFVAAAILFSGCKGCTKQNPDLCCVDEADCAANHIPDGTSCQDGLVCRGNQCIAEDCETSAECETGAPYCLSGMCTASCGDDTQCPGFGGAATDTFCVNGGCVACRMDADCDGTTPICAQGACRACAASARRSTSAARSGTRR